MSGDPVGFWQTCSGTELRQVGKPSFDRNETSSIETLEIIMNGQGPEERGNASMDLPTLC